MLNIKSINLSFSESNGPDFFLHKKSEGTFDQKSLHHCTNYRSLNLLKVELITITPLLVMKTRTLTLVDYFIETNLIIKASVIPLNSLIINPAINLLTEIYKIGKKQTNI